MAFYESIAQYYDRIFPPDEEQVGFLNSAYIGTAQSLLDIGCGTGTILAALAPRFDRVAGIDLDRGLIDIAERKLSDGGVSQYRLIEGDMRSLRAFFPEEKFSLITCLGNTIPHVTARAEIGTFFSSAFEALERGGMFIFQIVNYDRVLDFAVRSLPLISHEGISFDRLYSAPLPSGLIDFSTVLRDPSRSAVIRNSVKLYPLRIAEIQSFISNAGFTRSTFFGDYDGSSWKPISPLTIGVCS